MANFVVTVRYGLMAATERFSAESGEFRPGDEVIVRTARGIDYGAVMSAAVPDVPAGPDGEVRGELLRAANETDRKIIAHIREAREPDEFANCAECIEARRLPMRLVGVEHLFSGDKIIFYFLADNRVDFRELVKDLARRYRTRIEMRQIGVRDEARLLADYEHCGRELCCRVFIRNLEPVTMRMAKMQKTTLDPSKISGHCGRLMCCLRFEDCVYSALQAEMPAKGAVCVLDDFAGEVVSVDIFRRLVTLNLPNGGQETVSLDDVREIRGRRGGKPSGRWDGGARRNDLPGSACPCRNGSRPPPGAGDPAASGSPAEAEREDG
ncbi:MAG: signal peptidase [Planctomycetota bacterium]|jgi:cell fate regulator YaaT (PSP1 superfamily)|nr:signal peptidase [Planctomycetota bacterium]